MAPPTPKMFGGKRSLFSYPVYPVAAMSRVICVSRYRNCTVLLDKRSDTRSLRPNPQSRGICPSYSGFVFFESGSLMQNLSVSQVKNGGWILVGSKLLPPSYCVSVRERRKLGKRQTSGQPEGPRPSIMAQFL